MAEASAYFALVPAAGRGERMAAGTAPGAGPGAMLPKQYLPLAGQPLIHHALAALCAVSRIERVFVVLAPGDALWARHDWSALGLKLCALHCGGATRAESVANGLAAISDAVAPEDWMLVHDAARPCLLPWHVDALIDAVGPGESGGILAITVADTLKRADEQGRIAETIVRDRVWQAQTPQMFRHGELERALALHPDVTDEAQAMEALGHRPRLVAADASNFKVTRAADLELAALILDSRAQAQSK